VLIIKNGAKGISVCIFIFLFDKDNNNRLIIVPIQNDRITAKNPADNPRNQPIPRINLPSPSPIKWPFEKYQIRAKGKAKAGPAIRLINVGKTKIDIPPEGDEFIKRVKKETIINI